MDEEPAAPASAAPETREVESPAEVARTLDWTPPTKEFAVFARSFEGADARQGAGEASPDSATTPPPEQVARPSAEPSGERPPQPLRVSVVTPRAEETTPAVTGEDVDGDGAGAGGEMRRDVDAATQADASEARGRVARVRDGTRARVGRMRDEAIVVLEETPDDSGLRFVVVAAALFVVFVVLLFLSTTVLR